MDFIVLEKHRQRVNICWAQLCKIQRRYFRSCAKDISRWYSLDQPTLLHTQVSYVSYNGETESWNRRNELGPGLRAGRGRAKGRAPCAHPPLSRHQAERVIWQKAGAPRTAFPTTSDQFIKDLNLSANLASLLNNHSCNTNADTTYQLNAAPLNQGQHLLNHIPKSFSNQRDCWR